MMQETTLHCCHIQQRYGRRTILQDVAITLHPQQYTLLTGENGTGKTTLLRILAGLDKPKQFQAKIASQCLSWRAYQRIFSSQIFYLHQQPYLFSGSVAHNLDYALPRQMSASERQQRVNHVLEWAQLSHLAQNDAKHLSGGEAQRVALTRAWLRQPRFLLLDEPTANMDSQARLRTQALLSQLHNEGVGLLIASHDPQHFAKQANVHLHLSQGMLHTSLA